MSINITVQIGRLAADGDLRILPGEKNTKVLNLVLAVPKGHLFQRSDKKANYMRVEIYGEYAEAIAPYAKKGRITAIQGSLQIDSQELADGLKYYPKIRAEKVEFLDWIDNTKDGQFDEEE